jgi:hypothetical protein
MSRIILKQLKQVIKAKLPNIKIIMDDSNIFRVEVVFYYKRTDNSIYPTLLSEDNSGEMFVHGEILLDDFPQKAPQMFLYGPLGHSHLYLTINAKYQICSSVDRSYQWFFKDSVSRAIKYNSSMTLKYYIVNMYMFLAQDDRETTITQDTLQESYEFWTNYNSNNDKVPDIQIPYNNSIDILYSKLQNTKKVNIIDKLKNKYDFNNIPEKIGNCVDFIDKSPLLLNNDTISIPLLIKKRLTYTTFKIVGSDLFKYNTVIFDEDKYYRTSLGYDFNDRFPIIIHSKLWNNSDSLIELQKITLDLCNNIYTNPIISVNRNLYPEDLCIFTISKLFDSLIIDMINNNLPLCDDILAVLPRLHHLFEYLKVNNHMIITIVEETLDIYRSCDNVNRTYICPNLGILCVVNLLGITKIDYSIIFEDFLHRTINNILSSSLNKDKYTKYDLVNNKFVLDNSGNDIITKIVSKTINDLKHFAIHKIYYDYLNHMDLQEYDKIFGTIDRNILLSLKKDIETIKKWDINQPHNVMQQFISILNIEDIDIEMYLNKSIDCIMNDLQDDMELPLIWSFIDNET